jgi:hypothetical protein
MMISGFWAFAIVFIIAITFLINKFLFKKIENSYSDQGPITKITSYEFRWRNNKAN